MLPRRSWFLHDSLHRTTHKPHNTTTVRLIIFSSQAGTLGSPALFKTMLWAVEVNAPGNILPENSYRVFTIAMHISGEGQHLEQTNIERPILQNFQILNIKRTNDELFDFFIFKFIYHFYICLNYSNTQILR